MKIKTYTLALGISALLCVPGYAFGTEGADSEIDELLGMDLQELTVYAASKKVENISDAPSIVSVITAKDIRRFGSRNLRDILERQTSLQMMDSAFSHDQSISIRGQTLTQFNNHVLFLINGRPMRDSNGGGLLPTLIRGFPIDIIEKIEIIRGPGSVLYGSNAYSGIINITTTEASNLNHGSVSLTHGSLDTQSAEGTFGQEAKGFAIVGGAKATNSKGFRYNMFDEVGTFGSFRPDNEDSGEAIIASYKGLTANLFHGRSKYYSLEAVGFPGEYHSQDNTFFDLGYEHSLFNDDWVVQYNATYNTMDWHYSRHSNEDILGEVSLQGKVFDNLNLLVGGIAENHDTTLVYNTSTSTQWFSGYAQLDYTPLDWLKLVLGSQVNKPDGIKKSFSPRVGAIVDFNDNWGMKLLYGEAFRSAYFLETDLQVPGIISGNPSLKPETIKTTELQFFYHTAAHSAAITFFHSKMENLITLVGFPIQIVNGGSISGDGIELEGKAQLTPTLNLTGNATWQTNEDDQGRDDFTYTPNLMAKLGLSYDNGKGYTLGIFDSYFGKPSQVRDFFPIVERNLEPESYHLLTLNADFDINALGVGNQLPPTSFSVFVDNLLDEDIFFPGYQNRLLNSYPNHSGRAVYGKITIKF